MHLEKRRKVLTVLLVMLICSLAFALAALTYFGLQSTRSQKVAGEQESVPYEAPAPDNLAILFQVEQLGCYDIFYFDFSVGTLTVTALPSGTTVGEARRFGYELDRSIACDLEGMAALIDRFGGIEMKIAPSSELLRLTGAQVVSYLQENAMFEQVWQEARAQILHCFFENIAIAGFTKDDFIFLTQHAETDISYPDFYNRMDQLPALCGNCIVVS